MDKYIRFIRMTILCFCILAISCITIVTLLYGTGILGVGNKVIYMVAVSLFLLATYLVLRKLNTRLQGISNKYWIGLFALCTILLYICSIVVRNNPTADYEVVYDSATALINGWDIDWSYFQRFEANRALLYLLSGWGYVAKLLGFTDYFYVQVAFNSILVTIGAASVFYIVGYYYKGKAYLQLYSVLMYYFFLPLWGGTQYMYSATVSMAFGVATIVCLLKKKVGWMLLGGVLFGVGYLLHPATIFCVIAFVVNDMLSSESLLKTKKVMACILGVGCVLCLFHTLNNSLMNKNIDETIDFRYPAHFWFTLGLLGDGSYGNNDEFTSLVYDAETYEQRVEIVDQVFKENIGELIDCGHIKEKIITNFGNGTFGLYIFQYDVGIGYMLFNPFGMYGGYVCRISSVYLYIILLVAIVASVLTIYERRESTVIHFGMFTLTGFIVFMMLWESNNRQMYTQIAPMALLVTASIEEVCAILTRRTAILQDFVKKRKIYK